MLIIDDDVVRLLFDTPLWKLAVWLAASIAQRFYHTRAFHYRIQQESPHSSTSQPKGPKLYLSLRDIRHHTMEGIHIFPNLIEASFEQLPSVKRWLHFEVTFLSNVTTVHLLHSTISAFDKPPHFLALGMTDVQSIHMHHIAGTEISNESDMIQYLGYQASLKSITFHLAEHFESTLGSSEKQLFTMARLYINGGNQIIPSVRAARSVDTEIYIHEYGSAIAMTIISIVFAKIIANSKKHPMYPALSEITIDIGREHISMINDNHEGEGEEEKEECQRCLTERVDNDNSDESERRHQHNQHGHTRQSQPTLATRPEGSPNEPVVDAECTDHQLLLKRTKKETLRWQNYFLNDDLQGNSLPNVSESTRSDSPNGKSPYPSIQIKIKEGLDAKHHWILEGSGNNYNDSQNQKGAWKLVS